MNDRSNIPGQSVGVMQIISLALVMGVAIFAAIAVFALGALEKPSAGVAMSTIAAGFAVIAFILHLIVPGRVMQQRLLERYGELDAPKWIAVFQTKLMFGLALLEGAAFFNLVALITEHNWWSLAVAGALVFWMLVAIPTRTRVEQWIETQKLMKNRDG